VQEARKTEKKEKTEKFVTALLKSQLSVTKSEPGSDLLIIPEHESLSSDRVKEKIKDKEDDIEALLILERDLMLQRERVDALHNFLNKAPSTKESVLQENLKSCAKIIDSAFDALMATVKQKDREIETSAWCLKVFFQEAQPTDAKRNSLYFLNIKPEDFVNDSSLEKTFTPLNSTGNVHKNNYGLWVIGAKVKSDTVPSRIGRLAKAHSAVAVMDIDTESLFPSILRCDEKGKRAKIIAKDPPVPGSVRAAHSSIKPVAEEDLKRIRGEVLTGKEGLDYVVLGLNPIRVRAETRYEKKIVDPKKPKEEGLGDVLVPLSYIFGGKTFFQAMVSSQDHVGAAVARGIKRSQVGDYSLSSLYSHEGKIDLLGRLPVISTFGITGWENPDDLNLSLKVLRGLHTAGGATSNNDVSFKLSMEYLRRIMTVYARGINGSEIQQIDNLANRIQATMVESLVGSGPDKPFTELEVLVDKTSDKGQKALAQNGVRLEVKVKCKTAISSVFVVIKPGAATAKLAESSAEG